MSLPVPDACTLPTAEQPVRQEEFATLCATSLQHSERISARHLRLTLSGDTDLADTVSDLAARESECCSFFDFTVTSTGDAVLLDVQVPATYATVLDGLSQLAAPSAETGPNVAAAAEQGVASGAEPDPQHGSE